jgi:hypothetical protein
MRIDSAIITGSFSVNGDAFNDLGAYTTTGSNTFVGDQSIVGAVSASALTGSISYTNLTGVPTLVSGSEQVVGILSSLNSFTASNSGTNTFTASATARLNSIEIISASNIARLGSVEAFTSSTSARLNSIETISASNIVRLNSLENKTGSLATTGSNTFNGDQIISGTVYIQNNLVVQGSSSLQNITASAVNIGTNTVLLNTANPSVRFAGISAIDSGSAAGKSGSLYFDSTDNEWIFVHAGNTAVTSSTVITGPETYDNIGNETRLTTNIIPKSTNSFHITDSCIFDNGTTTCIKNNLIGTGTACFGNTTTIACNLVVGNTTNSSSITIKGCSVGGFTDGYIQWGYSNQATAGLSLNSPGTNFEITTGYNEKVALSTGTGLQVYTNNGVGTYTSRMLLDRSGNACFSGNVCALTLTTTDNINLSNDKGIFIKRADGTLGQTLFLGSGNELNIGFGVADTIRFATYLNTERLRITSTGIACFSCQVCAPAMNIMTSGAGVNTAGGILKVITGGTATGIGVGQSDSNRYTHFAANDIQVFNDDYFISTRCAFPLSIGTCYTARLTFAATGIACFSCQVCTPVLFASTSIFSSVYCVNSYNSLSATPSGQMGVLGHNAISSQAIANTIVQMNNGYYGSFIRQYYNEGITFYTRANAGTAGDVLYGTGAVADGGQRLRIDSTGISCFACTICSGGSLSRKGYDYHTGGQWYKIPFYIEKTTGSGTARTVCLVTIDNNDSFQELIFTIEYGSRLQGVSDSYTQTSLRTYGVNRFVGGTASITDSNLITGGSGCAINTHAPMTVAIDGTCRSVVKVDFSSSLGSSSFVWGEVRIFSIESLTGKITISGNNY